MSIQDWGSIGEVIGALGLLITVRFLVYELRLDPKPLKAEQGLLRQIPNMGASRTGALIEKERNAISLRSED